MTQRLKDLAKELAHQYGVRRLKRGETRPPDYYIGLRATGQPFVRDKNAVIRVQPEPQPDRPSDP